MNDYYKVVFDLKPANNDACDLLAAALAEAGYESFEPAPDGSAMTAYVPAALFSEEAVGSAVDECVIPVEITHEASFVEGRDWNSEWERNYFKPIVVAGQVAVHSSFHTDVPEARFDIVIDPRMAFGTGHHATTTLMMQSLLEGGDVEGANVIDMGTGTGILAILATMLGAKEAVGIEIDPFAAANAVDNLALNLPADAPATIIEGDASALEAYAGFADVFLANINRNIITADIARYAAAMKPGARITVSGFYVDDRPIVAEAAAKVGLEPVAVAEMDRWSSMTFTKPALS
ncbi:MAG: 50S ribosomal protein L11 methyltransferase [Muribaculaceae bacterium]|nr:50S ribosomal protein L11 methyltransferase [Muribaculaceae bacterium]